MKVEFAPKYWRKKKKKRIELALSIICLCTCRKESLDSRICMYIRGQFRCLVLAWLRGFVVVFRSALTACVCFLMHNKISLLLISLDLGL